jgi:hypothetical protein
MFRSTPAWSWQRASHRKSDDEEVLACVQTSYPRCIEETMLPRLFNHGISPSGPVGSGLPTMMQSANRINDEGRTTQISV